MPASSGRRIPNIGVMPAEITFAAATLSGRNDRHHRTVTNFFSDADCYRFVAVSNLRSSPIAEPRSQVSDRLRWLITDDMDPLNILRGNQD